MQPTLSLSSCNQQVIQIRSGSHSWLSQLSVLRSDVNLNAVIGSSMGTQLSEKGFHLGPCPMQPGTAASDPLCFYLLTALSMSACHPLFILAVTCG